MIPPIRAQRCKGGCIAMQMEKTRDRMLRAMFVALIAAGEFIRIPVPVVPFTLQYLFTMLAGLLLGGRKRGEAVRLCARRVQPAVSDVPLRHGALRDREGGSGPGAGCDEGVVSALKAPAGEEESCNLQEKPVYWTCLKKWYGEEQTGAKHVCR